MKRTALVFFLISILILGGCKANTETEPVKAQPENNTESYCYLGTCIKSAFASVDEEYFMVLFDITPINGIIDANTAPQFTTPVTIHVEDDDGTEYVNQVFTQEEYYCYVGKDVPWAVGQITALCGIGIPIEADTIVPALDDHIIVSIPEFGDYQVELEVGNSL
ncbi:MAG: hypothetical protein JEZ00_07980 [Anaerolineaceae bacterium]|nr:hypothetical protein [Anaerolineaceae bacterium]